MKKRVILTEIISLALIFGMAVLGCKNPTSGGTGGGTGSVGTGGTGGIGGDSDVFAGTWTGIVYEGDLSFDTETHLRVVAANKSWKAYATCTYPKLTNRECGQGTYTVSGGKATVTIKKTLYVWWDGSGNVTKTEWQDANKSQTVTITGGSTSFQGSTFTKQ
ncbi:hypothetical protein FACS1894137_19950 [Spirochaetia bacterium]|nr:hypothetical protein FACS1894137_19950 [Spirochaetia bacterium]